MLEENCQYGVVNQQKRLLEMMQDIHLFCEENEIKYSLAGGTLIGAIRHNGYIPWDDDIDIMMDRVNYNKFLKLLKSYKGYYLFKDLWIDRIEKIDGDKNCCIDIFIADYQPDNWILSLVKTFIIMTLQGMIKPQINKKIKNPVFIAMLRITHFMGRLIKLETKQKWYEYISQLGNKHKSNYVRCYNDEFHVLKVKYRATLMENIILHKFEDKSFYITTEYDHYLQSQYGEYMRMPEEKERVPKHNFTD